MQIRTRPQAGLRVFNRKGCPQSDKEKAEARYSASNPPPSKEVAQERIDLLRETIAEIDSHRAYTEPRQFLKAADYYIWYRRAGDAIVHTRKELLFLIGWMSRQKLPTVADHRAKHLAAIELKKELIELTELRLKAFTTLHGEAPAEPEQRRPYMISLRSRVEQTCSELDARGIRILLPGEIRAIKKILSPIFATLNTELLALKSLKKVPSQQSENPIIGNWQRICYRALKRANEEGFTLLPDEQDLLDQLQRRLTTD